MILCLALLSASIPLLLAISDFPEEAFFGENVYTITQVTNGYPIEVSLSEQLANESWIDVVSPEIYAFVIVKDHPVVIRGVEAPSFLDIEGGTVIEGSADGDFLIAGEGLASRIGTEVGERIVLTGSTSPKITELELTGIFRSTGPSNDELLVPLEQAWMISSVGRNNVLSIRVRTTDYDRLLTYLNETGKPMVLGDGVTSVVLNSKERFDARVATLIFQNPELGGQRGISHTSAVVQQAGNSVRIVVLSFIVLNSSLILLGLIAVLSKALIEKRKDIGILSAIGATKGRIRAILLLDLTKISLLSVFVGLSLGLMIAHLIGATSVILLFGHGVRPALGIEVLLGLLILGLALLTILGLLVHEFISREKPLTLMSRLDASRAKERDLEEVLSE